MQSYAVAQKTAQDFGVPFFDLNSYEPSYCPTEFLQSPIFQNGIGVPLYVTDTTLFIATTDPSSAAFNDIAFLTGKQPYFLIVESDKLAALQHKLTQCPLHHDLNYVDDEIEMPIDVAESDGPAVRFINNLLLDAIKKHASDIHFEPYEQQYRIRFRIDGLLVDAAKPPRHFANYLTARLKIMANLDISERRLPQDGRIISSLHGLAKNIPIDCRVSTCPTLQGEKIVLRLLESNLDILNIANLGFDADQQALLINTLQQSKGLILVTGPTGSGKTVTLYTALSLLNTIEKNISTVEDPVEIQLPGINQVHINPKTGLSFATALRALLRQDPDIIMVGEIRDVETAEIAVKASQTGHLVLSTLHTNNAAEAIVRLKNMGIHGYNIASSISLIIAQRLVRKLCEACKVQRENIFVPNDTGCHLCTNGYCGRIGIYEVMPISNAMAEIIMNNGNSITIAHQAQSEGIKNLHDAGLEKVRLGMTSLTEINRVI